MPFTFTLEVGSPKSFKRPDTPRRDELGRHHRRRHGAHCPARAQSSYERPPQGMGSWKIRGASARARPREGTRGPASLGKAHGSHRFHRKAPSLRAANLFKGVWYQYTQILEGETHTKQQGRQTSRHTNHRTHTRHSQGLPRIPSSPRTPTSASIPLAQAPTQNTQILEGETHTTTETNEQTHKS